MDSSAEVQLTVIRIRPSTMIEKMRGSVSRCRTSPFRMHASSQREARKRQYPTRLHRAVVVDSTPMPGVAKAFAVVRAGMASPKNSA